MGKKLIEKLKVQECLDSYVFWMLLNLNVALFFLTFFGPYQAIPGTCLAIYYRIIGPKRDERIKAIRESIKKLEEEDRENKTRFRNK